MTTADDWLEQMRDEYRDLLLHDRVASPVGDAIAAGEATELDAAMALAVVFASLAHAYERDIAALQTQLDVRVSVAAGCCNASCN